MNITLESLGYRLVPGQQRLDFSIERWVPEHISDGRGRGKRVGDVIPARWAEIGFYPTSPEHGLRKIRELAIINDDSTLELDAAIKRIEAISESVKAALPLAVDAEAA